MIERPNSEQLPSDNDPKPGESTPGESTPGESTPGESTPGTFLKEIDEDTDVDAGDVKDESDGMPENDFLGKSNLRNRGIESEEDKE